MSKIVVVEYRTRPDAAEENQRLVEQVYAQLAREEPDGLRYATFWLTDGVTFIHNINHRRSGQSAHPTERLHGIPAGD